MVHRWVKGSERGARLGWMSPPVLGLLIGLLGQAPLASAAAVYEVKASNRLNSVVIGGTVVPGQSVNLSAQLPGRVVELAGHEGDRFTAGTLLVRLDERELLAQKAAAEAAISGAEAAARNAQVQYQRELVNPRSERPSQMSGMAMPGMFDQMFSRPMASMIGMESPALQRNADLYQQGSAMHQANTSAAQARARLAQIESKLRDSRSLAPFNGVVVSKSVEVGDTVQPGMPLMVFADIDHLQVKVDVPSRLIKGLSANAKLKVRLDGRGEVLATVAQVFPVADPERHTVTVKLDLPKDSGGAPGMYADVLMPDKDSHTASRPVVPRSALVWRGSVPGVMRLDGEGKPQLRLIRVRDLGDPHTVEVFAGLKVGDRVVLEP